MKLISTLLLAVLLACAQEPAAPQEKAPQEKATEEKAAAAKAPGETKRAVRRFSAGGVLLFSAFQPMSNLSTTEQSANRTATYSTTPLGYRFGGGGTVSIALGDRFAFASAALLRRARFSSNNEVKVTTGTTTSTTTQSDFSSADFWEFPFTVRRYNKSHLEQGSRWFAEGGWALRRVRNIRSSLETVDANSKTICCDEQPVAANNKLSNGIAVGGGYQFIDQIGLRIVPQVRYTRWLQPTFDLRSIRSNPNQLEAGLAITF